MIDPIRISKFLSLILRHKPDAGNITLDKNGYTSVSSVIDAVRQRMAPSFQLVDLVNIVRTNSKKRFEFDALGGQIRACQGHSIGVDLNLKSIQPPQILYHGTGQKSVNSILQTGLEKRNRDHVHMADDVETAYEVGARHGVPVVFIIWATRMCMDGFKFYLSANNVWLTDHVPSMYLELDGALQ